MNKKLFSAVSPAIICLSLIIVFLGDVFHLFVYMAVVAIHELAHYYVAKKRGYKLGKFYVMPYGVCLNYKDNIISGGDEIAISFAGPAINLCLCFICVALWWLFPITYYYLDYFCFCNLVLGAFNLMPCFPLDGGRVFVAILSKKIERENALKISLIINYVLSLILLVSFVISIFIEINFTLILLSIFLFSGTINPNKFSSYNYLSLGVDKKRLIKNGADIKIIAVSSSTPIYKIMAKVSRFKFNIIYVIFQNNSVKVISEFALEKLALKFSPTFCFDELKELL